MMRKILAVFWLTIGVQVVGAQTQEFQPPPPFMPDAETMTGIEAKRAELHAAIERLQKSGAMKVLEGGPTGREFDWGPMVEVFAKAGDWIVRRNEFLQKDSGKQTLAVLDEGLHRAKDFTGFVTSLENVAGRTLACGYRSRVDNSIQPYVVTFPVDFGKDPKKDWRLDIVLHGRDNTLTEVKTLAGALNRGPTKPGQNFIQLEVFGRGNNAYRWAGETDVFEARIACIKLVGIVGKKNREKGVDFDRIVLRGFSMGGAGVWHLGLHCPTDWCVIGPGAGFTTTHGYINKLPAHLPDYQEACLHIYDAVDYAENAAMVPVVAYAGDKDPQQQAALNIEEKLKPLGIPMTRLVGTGLAHQFPPEWQKRAQEAYAAFVERGQNWNPKKVHFVTYTLSYPACSWIQIYALEQHYARASVDAVVTAEGYDIDTKNVLALAIRGQPEHLKLARLRLRIDGQSLTVKRPAVGEEKDPKRADLRSSIPLTKVGSLWHESAWDDGLFWSGIVPDKLLRKGRMRHGPIDEAFKEGFICIRGTGNCASPQVQAYTDAALTRFRREWELGFRGELPVITDKEFMKQVEKAKPRGPGLFVDGRGYSSLILFGDPSSNQVLREIIADERTRLPLSWNAKEISFGGQTYSAESHVPAFIYPDQTALLPTLKYIVVNSGHTFHEADLLGTNALLYPRLGDFAILKPTPTKKDPAAAEVVRAGLFDENWTVPADSTPAQK